MADRSMRDDRVYCLQDGSTDGRSRARTADLLLVRTARSTAGYCRGSRFWLCAGVSSRSRKAVIAGCCRLLLPACFRTLSLPWPASREPIPVRVSHGGARKRSVGSQRCRAAPSRRLRKRRALLRLSSHGAWIRRPRVRPPRRRAAALAQYGTRHSRKPARSRRPARPSWRSPPTHRTPRGRAESRPRSPGQDGHEPSSVARAAQTRRARRA